MFTDSQLARVMIMMLGSLTLLQGAAARDHPNKKERDLSPDVDDFTYLTKQYLNQLQHEAFCYLSEEIFAINQEECWQEPEDMHPVLDVYEIVKEAANQPALLPVPDYVLNDEVRGYQPTAKDLRYFYESGENEMIVFKDVTLDSKEQKILADFEAWLAKTGNSVPQTFRKDNEMLRFYFANNSKFDKAYSDMLDYTEYMHTFQIPTLQDAEEQIALADEGFVYGYKRDKGQRPNFVLNLRTMIDLEITVDELMDSADFLAGYTQYHALVPGQIETWNLIVDAKDVSLSEFPLSSLYGIVQRLKRGYKQRMHNIVAINIHWLLKSAAQVVFNFVPANVGEKIFFFGKDYQSHLHKLIGKGSLEKRFGGKLPNKTDNFFPPQYN